MKTRSWRLHARKVILSALESGRLAGLEGKALEKHVSDAYPFGERSMHPYKIWLNEFSLLVKGQRKPMSPSRAKKGPKLLGSWPGWDGEKAWDGIGVTKTIPGQTNFEFTTDDEG